MDYYLKAPPTLIQPKPKSRFLSFLAALFGALILGVVFGSLGFYQWRARQYSSPAQALVLGEVEAQPSPAKEDDYTNPHLWFTTDPQLPSRQSKITHYNLSVPILNIHRAVVEIGGEDLGKSMIHYPGTALPGEIGNAVIFCHSVLPQFFNPKNYKTICSTLPTIEIGDEIIVYFDGIEFLYQVIKLTEVKPSEIWVMDQGQKEEYLSLITCVPPGTYLKRLVVKAKLI